MDQIKTFIKNINQSHAYLLSLNDQDSNSVINLLESSLLASGKTSLENIKAVEQVLSTFLYENGIIIDKYYYCYHHPDGVVAEYSGECKCRKPGTLFLEDAIEKFNLNAKDCWFVGDRDTDVECGKAMGMRTVQVKNKHSGSKAGKETPDEFAADIYEAVLKIVERG